MSTGEKPQIEEIIGEEKTESLYQSAELLVRGECVSLEINDSTLRDHIMELYEKMVQEQWLRCGGEERRLYWANFDFDEMDARQIAKEIKKFGGVDEVVKFKEKFPGLLVRLVNPDMEQLELEEYHRILSLVKNSPTCVVLTKPFARCSPRTRRLVGENSDFSVKIAQE